MKKPFSKLFNLLDKTDRHVEDKIEKIPVEKIVPNRFQPRKVFDNKSIKELADSIEVHGLLQPITLRPIEEGMYEIIAGERRFRAIKSLHFENVESIIRYFTDQEAAVIAIIENIQREDLSPYEEALAYKDLLSMDDITQKDLAHSLGKSQSFIANKLRLLKLSSPVITALQNNDISERHARAMLSLDNAMQYEVLEKVKDKDLTVKDTEQLVKNRLKQKETQINFNDDMTFLMNDLDNEIQKIKRHGHEVLCEKTEDEDTYIINIKIKK
ncbi:MULTISPECIES: ParB/RepB/Spo0J family partition protein [Nosocomiicoccus]|uniref:ParB/RepB/Spo0J family partition protein n=1 Tax=Nosocomiicoccus massiliensis TaxID=1232430 RepID=A0AAF0YNE2_9STAP|nr:MULTISPECIES: ParB/RepB/Spo0J family partition protein [Nosocomiicoccus]OFL47263.1 nucleoid occlusion protein [Nosocomiicoccus sp. HMSC067E10]OFO56420.1 nucleoid occlusion protein [Nosocomiicoccus sp. HMSC059G07]OFS63056.1 nucleoid occlusion protein [Nosocomiicoccus sp. HMSC09A07]WOS95686.1 ParB/RepB/Spo0J family partition protein [Nosocomiicoccus massiliensis]